MVFCRPSKEELKDILEEIDEDGSGEIEFPEFCQLCAKFLVEEPDEDTLKAELKEAFRWGYEINVVVMWYYVVSCVSHGTSFIVVY